MKISNFIKAGIGAACFIGAFRLTIAVLKVSEAIASGAYRGLKDLEKDTKESTEETKEEETKDDED